MADTINDEIYQALYPTYASDVSTMLWLWKVANNLTSWTAYADYVRTQSGVSNINDAELAFWSTYTGGSGPAVGDGLLLESGDFLLLESGDYVLLEA